MTQPLLPLAAAAGLFFWPQAASDSLPPPADQAYKVEICHIPPGNPENAHVISVSIFAVPAHIGHGDPDPFSSDPHEACGEVPPTDDNT